MCALVSVRFCVVVGAYDKTRDAQVVDMLSVAVLGSSVRLPPLNLAV